jgi:predicted ATP-binding protein involved in virulence
MSATLAWLGNLIGRLGEIYESADADKQPFVVMVDEIDAHLHPAWQQALRAKLQTIFPLAQFIVSTHSPLVVAGSTASQVIRLERASDGGVRRVAVEDMDMIGFSDSILRSPAFGLGSTLDPASAELRETVRMLMRTRPQTLEGAAKLRELSEKLSSRLTVSPAVEASLNALQIVRKLISEGEFSRNAAGPPSRRRDEGQNSSGDSPEDAGGAS